LADLPGLWLRGLTQARVGLGRAGNALPTSALLDFQIAHARARDAVQAVLDVAALAAELGIPTISVHSQASNLAMHLQRPDLGRKLDPADAAQLVPGDWELAVVIGDGLSATAVQAHAAPLVAALVDRLGGWKIAPPVIARHARVALGDDIGAALGARLVLVLIGERPGMSAPDSLGAYLTYAPQRGCPDSLRNCVSNIRPPQGLSYDVAADRIAWLLTEARRRGITGTALKESASLRPSDGRIAHS
jgi:ethanolamine ammonia-lyase small subunit